MSNTGLKSSFLNAFEPMWKYPTEGTRGIACFFLFTFCKKICNLQRCEQEKNEKSLTSNGFHLKGFSIEF